MNDYKCTCKAGLVMNMDQSACIIASAASLPATNSGAPTCQSNQVFQGNPINVGTGLKSEVDIDYRAPSGLEFKRVYNSQSAYESSAQSALGQGGTRSDWNRSIRGTQTPPPSYPITFTNLVYRVGLTPNWIPDNTVSTAFVSRGDGKTYTFTRNGDAWQADADINDRLTSQFNAAGGLTGWTYTTGDQSVEQYNADGQLVSITERTGQTRAPGYSDGTAGANGDYVLDADGTPTATPLPAGLQTRITDAYGRSLTLGYDAQSRIVKMTDPAGGVYRYTYDANSNLNSVTYPDNKTKQYLFENAAFPHALTGILDENGARFATYAYDSTGRAISSEHAGGAEKIVVAYNPDGTSSITDALGTARTQFFQKILGVVRNGGASQPGGSGCGAASSAVSYDPNGNVSSRTDFNGNTTCHAHDPASNLETARIEGLASGNACPPDLAAYTPSMAPGSAERKTTTGWNASLRLPAIVAEPLRLTTYTYDSQGNLLTRTLQATLDTTGAQGLAPAVTGTPQTTTYTYNATGQVLAVDGPRTDIADITTYTYGAQGNLATVSNALNQITTVGSYDANGRPGAITDPNGLVTGLAYDARGRLVARNTGGETTGYTYDGAGQLLTVTSPGGASYNYTYDAAHRLTQIADGLGNKLVYTLDNAGNRTKEQLYDSTGTLVQTHSRVFDALNRLYRDIGAVNQTTIYAYDANGNLTSVSDPLNRITTNAYDALNRLITSTDAANGQTRYGYDGLDRLTQVTDPRNLVTGYILDGLGNQTALSSPDTGNTLNTFDAAGNLLTRTDAKGQTARYQYDALNRITQIGYADGNAIGYLYDQSPNGIGRLSRITDASGSTQYSYDLHGRVDGEERVIGGQPSTTLYRYDSAGRLAGVTYPSGRSVDYTRDSIGRIARIDTTKEGITLPIVTQVNYQPFGPANAITYGNGQSDTRSYDLDGRTTRYTLNDQTQAISYDAASRIAAITDPQTAANSTSYGYDLLDRLTGATRTNSSASYAYDAADNRTGYSNGAAASSFSYDSGSNRLAQITGSQAAAISTDPNGSITGNGVNQFTYDARGRMISASTASGTVQYQINGLGQRVQKITPTRNTVFHYDTGGKLIAETIAGPGWPPIIDYIYLNDMPVAVIK